MANSKVVIETSPVQKDALYTILRERGTTLTDWFNDKVAELRTPYQVSYDGEVELGTGQDLADVESILTQIKRQDWSFTDADTTYLSHNIHPYPAKFIPQIPRHLIKMLSLSGELVWDPFGGSGTTALEALLAGRQAISSDINPVASLVGQAKTSTLTKAEMERITDLAEKLELLTVNSDTINKTLQRHETEIQANIPAIPNIDKWFHPQIQAELGYLRGRINGLENHNCQILAQATFSKIIVKASFQDGETRYSCKPRDIEAGYVLRMFAHELTSAVGKVRQLAELLQFRQATFKTVDLRNEDVVSPNSVDLIVTSPPYPNATDYHLYHRFRIFWLGHDPRPMGRKEIGSHLRHQKEKTGIEQYLAEMKTCLQRMLIALRSGRYAVLVLGDAIFKQVDYQTAELVGELAEQGGFERVGIVPRQLHATKRSFISPARRLREEKLLILRKPLQDTSFHLQKPNYKLWPYEAQIRRLEIEKLLGIFLNGSINDDTVIPLNPLMADRLRRLTFTHGFWNATYQHEPTWQAILENGKQTKANSKRKEPKYVTHGLHAYKGKFYPQLAKSLFNLAGLEPGQTVLDPFCGSGTVLLEGYLNGLTATGFDINPLAAQLARIKTAILTVDLYLVDRLLSQFIGQLEQIDMDSTDHLPPSAELINPSSRFTEACLAELQSWFPEPVLRKIGWIFQAIDDIPQPTLQAFLELCLSSIVRNISQQDPKDLRIRRRKTPLEDAPVKTLYLKKVREQQQRIRHFAQQSNRAPTRFGQANAYLGDCRNVETFQQANIAPQSINAVVTSPPYATALPYIDTDRLSILLLFGLPAKQRTVVEHDLVGSREIAKRGRVALDQRIAAGQFDNIISPTAQETISRIYQLNSTANVGFRRQNKAALLYRYYRDMTSLLHNLHPVVAPGGSLFFVIGDNKTTAGGEEIIIKSGQFIRETGQALGWQLVDSIPITVTQENRRHNRHGITENEVVWFGRKLIGSL